MYRHFAAGVVCSPLSAAVGYLVYGEPLPAWLTQEMFPVAIVGSIAVLTLEFFRDSARRPPRRARDGR